MKNQRSVISIIVFVWLLTSAIVVNAQKKCDDVREGLWLCTKRATTSTSSRKGVRIRVSMRNLTGETKMLEIYRPEQHYDVQVFNPDGSRLPTTLENKYRDSKIVPRELSASMALSHGMGEVPFGPLQTIKTDLNLSKKYTFVKGTYRVEISRRIRTRSLGRVTLTLAPIFVRVT